MQPEHAPLSSFPSEGNPGLTGWQQPAPSRMEDSLAGFTTERMSASADRDGRLRSDESLTRLRMAVAGFHWEMDQLKSQRATALKEPAAPPETRNFWRRVLRFSLFAGGLMLTAAAAHFVGSVIAGPDAAATLSLSRAENLAAATIAAPVAAVASRPINASRPVAGTALLPPTVAPLAPTRRGTGRAAGQRTATNGVIASPATQRFKGSLIINSEPQGGTVFINQARVGVTPLRLDDYPAGSYALWIQREGYQRWTASVLVPANRVTQVTSKLAPR